MLGNVMHRVVPWLCVVMVGLAGCASLGTHVRQRAAHDFSCSQDKVRVLDQYASVVRVAGCGLVATYQCRDTRNLSVSCHRLIAPEDREVSTTAGSYSLKPRDEREVITAAGSYSLKPRARDR